MAYPKFYAQGMSLHEDPVFSPKGWLLLIEVIVCHIVALPITPYRKNSLVPVWFVRYAPTHLKLFAFTEIMVKENLKMFH